jgi:5-methylcytosine-specific restriction protein A
VFGPKNRVEVSEKARLFTGATRRAIELRDRECTHPYCDLPASACQVDHIIPDAANGPTTQENGRLLCGFHNRLRNERPPPPAA